MRYAIKHKGFLFEDTVIDGNFTSDSVKVGTSIQSYNLSFDWTGGTGDVDMVLQLEGSVDNVNFAIFNNDTVNLTEDTGVIIFDVTRSGMEFVRISIVHTDGSITASCLKTTKVGT